MKATPKSKYAHRLTHGETCGGHRTPEFTAWINMLDRCYNPNAENYKRYGGRGITVCAQWRADYGAFLADMGRRPSKRHSLNRIDNDLGYFPKNCEWTLAQAQAINRRSTLIVGNVPLLVLAQKHNILPDTLRKRLYKGWSLEDALTRPIRSRSPSS